MKRTFAQIRAQIVADRNAVVILRRLECVRPNQRCTAASHLLHRAQRHIQERIAFDERLAATYWAEEDSGELRQSFAMPWE